MDAAAVEWYLAFVLASLWYFFSARKGFRWQLGGKGRGSRLMWLFVRLGIQIAEDRISTERDHVFYSGREIQFRMAFLYATPRDLLPYSKRPQERIAFAAIRHPDGMIHAVRTPGRHHHVIRYMDALKRAGLRTTTDQGFLTTYGRYVDRRVGLYIAEAAGQIRHKTPPAHVLFSDDMW